MGGQRPRPGHAAEGEEKALPDQAAQSVERAVRAVLGSGAGDIEDVTQEALLALHRALPLYRGEASVARFAHRIAVRVALGARYRRATRLRRFQTSEDVERESRPPPDSAGLAMRDAFRARQRATIIRLLGTLTRVQAETLVLRVMLGFSLDEVSRLTEVPRNTVRSRLSAAREALRHRIEHDPTFVELLDFAET